MIAASRSTYNRRRVHPAIGTAAAAVVGVATVIVGAQFLALAPSTSDTSAYCAQAYQCLLPGADQLLPHGLNPLAPYGPAMWNSGLPHTGGAV